MRRATPSAPSSATDSATAADWRIRNLRYENGRTRWEVLRSGAAWAEFEMHLAGEHNALNATAAAALAAGQGIAKEAIAEALATFKSVKRRLEVRAEIDGITLIEDFAHHPTAIRETLRALRCRLSVDRASGQSWSRAPTRCAAKCSRPTSSQSLRLADRVVLAAVYQQERIPEAERLHPEEVVRALNAARHARRAVSPMPTPSSPPSRRSSRPATSSPSFPTAASTASTRNSPRACASAFPPTAHNA